jgi:hypothetical protein
MGAVASVYQPSTLRMLIWPEASNAQNSIATYHQCDRAAARAIQAADQDADGSAIGRHRRLHHIRRDPAQPLNQEPQRTSSVVLGMGFDNTPEGSLFRSFKQVEGRFHREFIPLRR